MSKFLIINADDFGYNREQNEAIKYLLKEKLISSTCAMAVAPEIDDAAKHAKANDIPIGVHLTINSDNADSPWHSISDGRVLPKDSKELTFHTTREYVKAELECQYELLTKQGVTVNHADNHSGTLYGINGRRFYKDAFDFCAKYNLPYRFPKTSGFLDRQLGIKSPKIVKAFQNHIVSCGERRNVKMLDDLASNPWNVEKIGNCDNLRKYYLDLIDNCIEGVTEIFLHPAMPLQEENQGEWQKRIWEYEILKSGCLLEKAKEKNIQVVSWDIFKEI